MRLSGRLGFFWFFFFLFLSPSDLASITHPNHTNHISYFSPSLTTFTPSLINKTTPTHSQLPHCHTPISSKTILALLQEKQPLFFFFFLSFLFFFLTLIQRAYINLSKTFGPTQCLHLLFNIHPPAFNKAKPALPINTPTIPLPFSQQSFPPTLLLHSPLNASSSAQRIIYFSSLKPPKAFQQLISNAYVSSTYCFIHTPPAPSYPHLSLVLTAQHTIFFLMSIQGFAMETLHYINDNSFLAVTKLLHSHKQAIKSFA